MYAESVGNISAATQTSSAQPVKSAKPEIEAPKPVEVKEVDMAKIWEKLENKNNSEAQRKADQERIQKILEKISKKIPNSEPRFGIHEATNRITIKIVDRDTKEVIKEFPPEETLDLIAKNLELAGVLMDKKL